MARAVVGQLWIKEEDVVMIRIRDRKIIMICVYSYVEFLLNV